MQELVTVDQAERALRLLAVGLPPLGLVVGAAVGAVRGRLGRGAAVGVAAGLSGPALLGMWWLYNGVVGIYGLDSVRGLLVNLAVFGAIGVGIGVVVGLVWRRASRGSGEAA